MCVQVKKGRKDRREGGRKEGRKKGRKEGKKKERKSYGVFLPCKFSNSIYTFVIIYHYSVLPLQESMSSRFFPTAR